LPFLDSFAVYLMFLSLIGAGVFFVYATFCAWGAYHGWGYEYAHPPDTKIQLTYYQECLKRYKNFPNKRELSFEALCESLVPIYSKAADLNRGINNMRFGLLHRANLAIFFTYITLGVSSASY